MPAAPAYSYSTASGESRLIKLPNGVAVSLAPASLLSVEGNRLSIKGEAYFAIDHRPSRQLVVVAGPLRISDVGTRFAASADVYRFSVEVADGKIQVDSGDRPVLALTAGQRLFVEGGKLSMSAA